MSEGTTLLRSSHGCVTFVGTTGEVIDTELDDDFGAVPIYVNVAEWRKTYPGEDPDGEEHDILDFGYIDSEGVYIPPDETWREDYKHMITGKET